MNRFNNFLCSSFIKAQVGAVLLKGKMRDKLCSENGSLSAETAAMVVVGIVLVGIMLTLATKSAKETIAPGVDKKLNDFFNFS